MILFQPSQKTYFNQEGESVLESAQNAGVLIENVCGGNGICGKCRVKVIVGEGNPVTAEEKQFFTEEELRQGFRLACKLVPKKSFQTLEVELWENRQTEGDDTCQLQEYSQYGRSWAKEKKTESGLGLAVDMGTTNIEVLLWEKKSGNCIGRVIQENKQRMYGADVISRITYAGKGKSNFDRLCVCLRSQVAQMIATLLKEPEVDMEHASIPAMVVGNSVMMHFFAREDVTPLTRSPYQIKFKEWREIKGEELGLSKVEFCLLPNIESFVGADTMGVLSYLQNRIPKNEKKVFAGVDVGTNGEIFLITDENIYVTSTAAGPAFEGGTISCGMRAERGAIGGVVWKKGEPPELMVVGDGVPKGICGSGLIEVVTALYQNGILDETGYINSYKDRSPGFFVESRKDGNAVILYQSNQDTCMLTQKDIRELQMAKAAIRTGIVCLLQACEIEEKQIETFYLAGAFGTHLNVERGKQIGLFPDLKKDSVETIGNAALLGASQLLWQADPKEGLLAVQKRTQHISLAAREDFQAQYLKAINFPPLQ